ncbi:MAG: RluA family pseudouridine synthase [Bacillota bacterium]|nr:RluA family pseudouridine synthase [Bacillota bacterium]
MDTTKDKEQLNILVDSTGDRLDLYISEHSGFNRSRVQKLIKDGCVLVNRANAKSNYKVKEGDIIAVDVPLEQPLEVTPEKIPLDVVYEDKDLIVINKQRGLVVHPAAGNYSGTLVNALLEHCEGELSGINGVIRPGIVHRIDKDTTGLLVVAKSDQAHLKLGEQIQNKTVTREYFALVHGNIIEAKGTIEGPIGRHPVNRKKMAVVEHGKPAVTHYTVEKRYKQYTLIKAKLETGRTHQIRVHFSFINHPVVGDPLYGPLRPHFKLTGQLLHAYKLGFIHPAHGEYIEFFRPIPEDFQEVLEKIAINNI